MEVRNNKLAQRQYDTAALCLEQGEYEFAISNFDIAIKMDENYAQAYLGRGIASIRLRPCYNNSAILDFKKFINLQPMKFDDFFKHVTMESEKYNVVVEDFSAIVTQLSNFENNNDRGKFYFQLQKYEEAIADFTKHIEMHTHHYEGYSNRAISLFRIKDYESSLKDINIAIKLNRGSSIAHAHRGALHDHLKLYDEAIADMSKSVALRTTTKADVMNDVNNIVNLEKLLIKVSSLEDLGGIKASSLFLVLEIIGKIPEEKQKNWLIILNELYMKIKPEKYAALLNIFGSKSGSFDEAMEKFLTIQKRYTIVENSINQNPLYNCAKAYQESELFICAIEDYTKIIPQNVKLGDIYSFRGSVYTNIGLYHDAILDHDRAIELGATFAYINRGHARFKLNLLDLALEDLSLGIKFHPCAGAYNNRGYLYFTKGEFRLAIADYVKALSFDVEHANANKYLEEIFNSVETREDLGGIGLSTLNLVFEIVPKFPEADQKNWLIMLKELNKRVMAKKLLSGLGFFEIKRSEYTSESLGKKIDESIMKIDNLHKLKDERQVNFENVASDEENNDSRNFYNL